MASFYANMASTATRLLTKFGQTVTFTRETVTGFDPVAGTETTTTSNFTGKGAIFDFRKDEIDGVSVIQSDKRLILEAVTTKPEIGDTVAVGGVSHRVQDVTETNPGGTVVAYELQLRV